MFKRVERETRQVLLTKQFGGGQCILCVGDIEIVETEFTREADTGNRTSYSAVTLYSGRRLKLEMDARSIFELMGDQDG